MLSQNKKLENMLARTELLLGELLIQQIEDDNAKIYLERFKEILMFSKWMSKEEFKQALTDLNTYQID
ncbi:hypothetical protein ACS2BO_29220 [Bacillus cereus group sp. BceL305]|uniref:hypothetical protein n=1 Tax=Bacillus cereus group sp. BceL305 TaxID=3444980 RepID=UPI000BE81E0E